MRIDSKKWWSPLALLGYVEWGAILPLKSLADLGEPRIGVITDAFLQPLVFEATGLSARRLNRLRSAIPSDQAFTELLAVFEMADVEQAAPAPLAGSYFIDGNRLTFVPIHRLKTGSTYRAVLQVPDIDLGAESTITIHRDVAVPPRDSSPQAARVA